MDREPDWLIYQDDCEPFDDCAAFDDCGLGADGQCSQAGTEWCDWECGRLG